MPGMDDARVRIERAKANFERLKSEITAYRDAHPDANMVEAEHDGKGHVKLVASIRHRPPKEWGLAAGDILIDLRCALDYAVYALAVANGGFDPPVSADRLEFPVCRTPDRWNQALGRRKLDGLCQDAIDYIESIQPYQPGNGGDTAALVAFDDLVGVNKHRFIHVVVAVATKLTMPIKAKNFELADVVGYKINGELKHGAVLAELRLVAKAQHAQVELKPGLTTYIGFEPTITGGPAPSVTYILYGLWATVDHYVKRLETYL